jgi:hypothetical protein
MKAIKKIVLIGLFFLTNILVGFSQIIDTVEIRKGTTVTYSINEVPVAGDEYRWEIIGGVPTPAASSGSGTEAAPYIINFSAGLTSISVKWADDNNTASSVVGHVRAQKRVTGGCASILRDLAVILWSAPSAAISVSPATIEFCSGGNSGFTIPVRVTGAPNFTVSYQVVNNLVVPAVTSTLQLTGAPNAAGDLEISVPNNLMNNTGVTQTYTITLTSMIDAFDDVDGAVSATANKYTITVLPGSSMSPITVSPSSVLKRR